MSATHERSALWHKARRNAITMCILLVSYWMLYRRESELIHSLCVSRSFNHLWAINNEQNISSNRLFIQSQEKWITYTKTWIPPCLALHDNHTPPKDSNWNGPFQSNVVGSCQYSAFAAQRDLKQQQTNKHCWNRLLMIQLFKNYKLLFSY